MDNLENSMSPWDGVSCYLTSEAIRGIQRVIYDQPWSHNQSLSGMEKRKLAYAEFQRILRENCSHAVSLSLPRLPAAVVKIIHAAFPLDMDFHKKRNHCSPTTTEVVVVTYDDLNAIDWQRYVPQKPSCSCVKVTL